MFETNFGIEIEMTGITRNKAAKIVAEHFKEEVNKVYDHYDTHEIKDNENRTWKIMSDSSIDCKKKALGKITSASDLFSVELVSPILKYKHDIDDLQELIRKLRKSGALTNESCGIHIHLDGGTHTAKSVKNFINIIASKNDLFYKALKISTERMRYCKKMDKELVENIKDRKPMTLEEIKDIWYEGYRGSTTRHYHSSRYHFLNLHSFFTRNHTIELRGFNSTLHAGIIRSYIVLALALNNQALTQKSASSKKPQTENEKFAMRTYLNRIGFIGAEFSNCREHLTKHLDGSAAWRFKN